MHTEPGFRRLTNFSDAIVAIAITLLVLPLVDSASAIGTTGMSEFFKENRPKLLAFALSFVVIANFWWAQHQTFERVQSYNKLLVGGLAVWVFGIVFLPFPTELLGSAQNGFQVVHGLYIGTMLVTALAVLVQQWAIVRSPDLQEAGHRGEATIDGALILSVLMGLAFVVAVAVPSIGLWALLVLLASRPLEHLLVRRRRRTKPTGRTEVGRTEVGRTEAQ
jgi:uncharacterized membrane protein